MSGQIHKSVFNVKSMDCAAEENLVRMRLDTIDSVRALNIDLPKSTIAVYHDGSVEVITSALESLGLGAMHIESNQVDHPVLETSDQKQLLWTVLTINFVFFLLEITTGAISNSIGLIADSLDMLADSLVYGMSLLAVGSTIARKKTVAMWSGYFQVALALVGLVEVLRRFSGFEVLPDYRIMIVVSILAIIANTVCLYLLQQSKDQDAHMQASMIFTSNDIIINFGVVAAGVLVMWLDTNLPDLLIGLLVFLIVMRGAMRILKLAK